MNVKRFTLELYDGTNRIKSIQDNGEVIYPPKVVELLNELHDKYIDEFSLRETLQLELQRVEEENKQLKQYKKAIWDCDSSKIIRVNKNTGEVDLVDKELEE